MPERDNTTVQSVDRALRLFEKIADSPELSLGSSELADYISVDKSSAFRLAEALRDQIKITDITSPFSNHSRKKRIKTLIWPYARVHGRFLSTERARRTPSPRTRTSETVKNCIVRP